jgi:hypothetical protein
MQHLLLAISIILLTVIAGNEHAENKTRKVSTIIEPPKVQEADVEHEPEEEVETGFSIRYFVIDKYGI